MLAKNTFIGIQSGTPSDYPFDIYTAQFYIECNGMNDTDSSSFEVPISISMQNSQQDWQTDMLLIDVSDTFSLIKISVQFTRSNSQKLFCLFIVFLMWYNYSNKGQSRLSSLLWLLLISDVHFC